jgi:integrase
MRRPKTYTTYNQRVRLNLKPGLGKYPLTKLSTSVVQSFFKQQLADGHSIRKVHMMRDVLRSALGHAMRKELVFRNVAKLVDLPSYQPDEVVPWNVTEAKRFLGVAREHRFYAVFLLLLLYGVREGEALGLRWCDVDADNHCLRIRQQVQRVNGAWQSGPVKTKSGRRSLPLISIVRTALDAHRKRQQEAAELAGNAWRGTRSDEELVFTSPNGLPVDPRGLLRIFKRMCAKHALRPIKIHDTRHTVGTLLKDLGVSDRDIQMIMGHANISTTQAIYQHGNTPAQHAAIEKAAAILFTQEDGSGRCRQTLPSNFTLQGMSLDSIFGADRGIRTHDPLFTNSAESGLIARLTEVTRYVEHSRKSWLLGIVAVTACRHISVCIDA